MIESETDYENLQALWADLESGLGIILSYPEKTSQFAQRVEQYAHWIEHLLTQDADAGLYILFQLAGNSFVGYSTAHALICAVLAYLAAQKLEIEPAPRTSLVHAALTMNVSMTALQDALSTQAESPTPEQLHAIANHPQQSGALLRMLGVEDPIWLHLVTQHHQEASQEETQASTKESTKKFTKESTQKDFLLSILNAVDRYAAMISPRISRPGRSAVESIRAIHSAIGFVLVRAVGVYPPGTYVQLSSKELAVVIRRTNPNTHPDVAIISTPEGELLFMPRIHSSRNPPYIESALSASTVRARLPHFRILQLYL
ncbi:MAG: hypothetical protein RIR79_1205 [Pseudomonadota bacterium]